MDLLKSKLTLRHSLQVGTCAWDCPYLRLLQILTIHDCATSHDGEVLEKSWIWWSYHNWCTNSYGGILGVVDNGASTIKGIDLYCL